jgi:hypothetical protein
MRGDLEMAGNGDFAIESAVNENLQFRGGIVHVQICFVLRFSNLVEKIV